MRYEDMRTAQFEDKRPIGQRLTVMPMEGYLHPAMNPPGYPQQMLNQVAEGSGADLPPPGYVDPMVRAGYRPRGIGPEIPPAQQMDGGDPDYRRGGPERSQQDAINYLRQIYGR